MKTKLLILTFVCSFVSLDGLTLCNERVTNATFSEHIAPIVFSKCASCHRPGQPGPFDLLTYDDVVEHSETIEAVVDVGYMPPWKASSPDVKYLHDRRLTDSEKDLIRRWNELGNPIGQAERIPALPSFPKDWQLGTPDLVVEMNGSFNIPASGPDVYRTFVFPVNLPEDKWIKAIEIKSQAQSTLHHALFFADPTKQARIEDGKNGVAGVSGMNFLFRGLMQSGGKIKRAELGLGGYVPGTTPTVLPGDLARPLRAGSDIVMQTHFHPSGKTETEHATLALYFADEAPSRLITPIQLPPMFGRFAGIDIPAGEKNYTIQDEFTLPADAIAIGVNGHAHYIGKSMKMDAILPTGKSITLMQIDDWDLDWQDNYYFDGQIVLPAGTKIKAVIRYDNSASNPENPFHPPQRIAWGRESTDEMGSIILSVIPKRYLDQDILDKAAQDHSRQRMNSGFAKSTQGRLWDAISRLDRNRDQILQKSELPSRFAALNGLFQRLDANGDGELDLKELKSNQSILQSLLQRRGN
ncbi:MAG: hypothetical protein AAF483_05350 [Planctomycetota bacterium]